MATDLFLDDSHRVLTTAAFEFVLNKELKRAVRSQNFLTLVSVKPRIADPVNADQSGTQKQIAHLISRELRDTDLVAEEDTGRLWLALLDVDLQNSMNVIKRLRRRLDAYGFPTPVTVEIGAATCPTHGADIDSLRRTADTHQFDQL